MSVYVTDPNGHPASEYETDRDLLLMLSRNLAEPGVVRLDALRLNDEDIFLVGIVLQPEDAQALAHHLLQAAGLLEAAGGGDGGG